MSKCVSVDGRDRIVWWQKDHPPNPEKYRKNCPKIRGYNQHHILPGTSMAKSIATTAGEKENFEPALKFFTKWNINDAHNLIALPGVKTYRKLYGKKGGRKGPISPPDMKGLIFSDKFNDKGEFIKRDLGGFEGAGSLPCH